MKELYLIKSLLATPEMINEVYFLEPHHFTKFGNEFEFIKTRYSDIGEISATDLLLHGYELPESPIKYDALDIQIAVYTQDPKKILNLARFLFDEYHKVRVKKALKELKNDKLEDMILEIKEIIDSVDEDYQKNKLEETIFDFIEPLFAKVHKVRNGDSQQGIELKTLPTMNKMIGGIMPTDLIGIYGKEKSSKSTLALEMMLDICVDQKIPGVIFSYEMDNELLTMKSLSMRLGININEFRNPQFTELSDDEFKQLAANSGRKFYHTKLFLVDQILDEYEIEAKIKKLLDHGIKIVLIDYLMLVSARNKKQSQREELNYLSKFFKRLAQKHKIAIILISQANDSGDREAEAKGLSRDSNYYFYVAKIEPNELVKINGKEYRNNTEEDQYIIKNRGMRHAKSGGYFITTFSNNKYGELDESDWHNTRYS